MDAKKVCNIISDKNVSNLPARLVYNTLRKDENIKKQKVNISHLKSFNVKTYNSELDNKSNGSSNKKNKKRKLKSDYSNLSNKISKKKNTKTKTKNNKLVEALNHEETEISVISYKKGKAKKNTEVGDGKANSDFKKRSLYSETSPYESPDYEKNEIEHEIEYFPYAEFRVLDWVLEPLDTKQFFKKFWEKKPLHINVEENEEKFSKLLSTKDIDTMLRKNELFFNKNIDVTTYANGVRETHNPGGRAFASVVWDFFNKGCSVRILNPQTFHKPIWKLLAALQQRFNSFCGANVYLTPPGTQGFAPHWDDIEAFVFQIEGKKRWRVYSPRCQEEILPRESSGNMSDSDGLGEPLIDTILCPGDLLYMPRGFIHQAEALAETHSMHVTMSTYQKTAWVDLLEKFLPVALKETAKKDVDFRRGLPRDYLQQAGFSYSKTASQKREFLKNRVKDLVTRLASDDSALDAAVDGMAKGFLHDALPPFLSQQEQQFSVLEGGERWSEERAQVANRVELTPDTRVRLVRQGCIRLVEADDCTHLYFSLENSREYHAEEPNYLEVGDQATVNSVNALIHAFPKFITVEHLPAQSLSEQMTVANTLWERGVIVVQEELIAPDSEDEELIIEECEEEMTDEGEEEEFGESDYEEEIEDEE